MGFKFCFKCERSRVPEGGCEMGRDRWFCASCFRDRFKK